MSDDQAHFLEKPSEDEMDQLDLDRLATKIRRSGWAAPSVFLLETARPFGFVASQALLLLAPIFSTAERLARLVEDPRKVEYLVRKIEAQQSTYPSEED